MISVYWPEEEVDGTNLMDFGIVQEGQWILWPWYKDTSVVELFPVFETKEEACLALCYGKSLYVLEKDEKGNSFWNPVTIRHYR